MGATNTSLSSRLRSLEAAKVRAAKLKRGAKLTAGPMAELLKVRWPALREWCDDLPGFEESGAFVRGGNGIEWSFNAVKTVNFLIARFQREITSQKTKNRDIRKAIGVDLPETEASASFQETKGLVELTLTVFAAAEKQRRYTLAEDVESFIAGYNQRVVDGIMGVRTRVDPNGNLPPHVRAAVDDALRSVASATHAEAARYIEEYRAGLQQAGTG